MSTVHIAPSYAKVVLRGGPRWLCFRHYPHVLQFAIWTAWYFTRTGRCEVCEA